MSLLELQRRMAEDVRRPLTAHFSMQPATDGGEATAQIASSYIRPNTMLTSFERLEIYNRQYWFRVIDVVAQDFPALNAVLGRRRFDALVLAYLLENPSTSFSLRNLGGKLPAWLDQHPELAGQRHELAVDVARLEWAYVEAFDRAELPPISAAEAARIVPSAVLALQPHLQLLNLRYPVDEIVLAVHQSRTAGDIVSNAAAWHERSGRKRLPKLRRSQIRLAVHRCNDQVYYRRLSPESLRLLTAIRDGHSVEAAVRLALKGNKENADKQAACIREAFAHATEMGWIVSAEDGREQESIGPAAIPDLGSVVRNEVEQDPTAGGIREHRAGAAGKVNTCREAC